MDSPVSIVKFGWRVITRAQGGVNVNGRNDSPGAFRVMDELQKCRVSESCAPLPSGASSSLTGRAEIGRTIRLDDAPDGTLAAGGRAGGVLAVIDAKAMLEVAQLAAGLAMIAQG